MMVRKSRRNNSGKDHARNAQTSSHGPAGDYQFHWRNQVIIEFRARKTAIIRKVFLKAMTMKMAIERTIKKKRRARGVRGKSRQTVPVNVETVVIERVDCLMKHVPFVDIIAVRQAGSNRQNSKQDRQKKNRTPANPVEDAGALERIRCDDAVIIISAELNVGCP